MRKFLLFIGWASLVGSVADGVILLVALWVVGGAGWSDWGLSVDMLLRESLPWLYWVKQLAFHIMPDGFVRWVFDLPALIYFPVRMVVSVLIGWWALSRARSMEEQFR